MINVAKLDFDLRAVGIPIDGVDSDGKIDFRPEATPSQIDQAQQIVVSQDPFGEEVKEQAQAQVLTNSVSTLKTLNGKDIKTLSTAELVTVIRFLLAPSGWIGTDDTIQVLA